MEEIAPYVFTMMAMLLGFFIYFYAPYWSIQKVPGPPALPLFGHLHLLAKHGTDVFTVLANRYGPVFRFHLGRQPLVIVADPELCKEVGIKKFKSICNRSLPSPISASPLHQKGLFFTRDSRWSAMRNSIISLYQPSHLASLIPTMQAYIDSATKLITANEEEDITFSDLSLKLATNVIGQAAFGVNFGLLRDTIAEEEVSAFMKEHLYSTNSLKMDLSGSFSIILGLIIPILQEPFRQILKRIRGTADWKIEKTNQKLSLRLDKIVAKRAQENERGSKDFLSAILNVSDSDGTLRDLFSQDYISALAYEHLLAGSATTSFTLSSLLYLVSMHADVEKKLIEEIDSFGPLDTTPSANDLQRKFPYLDQVIKETMRFYTVSPLVARETSEQVEVGGYVLPKGTWVWIAIGVLAKDPKHFPDPDVFRPERFDPACDEEKQRHPYAHIPFGIGPRACVGQKFALQEIKLSVINLYRRYIFRHSPKMEYPLEFQYGLVLNFKNGVKLQAIERKT
ncbi:hypothetical protein J5N97_012939 [Dioscorea zingiberensis]|uniref:Cytochrome P450 n=1 Tax=Dioscorea zingiberensis TaxID=325984 RepID=A0A9D5CPZ5_9LILI|nr:hypothetical protein J5N97_012939 [Dioscorea zingiberensis]